MTKKSRFWEEKPLAELTPEEWESLCDGCAKCCLHKIEDIDSGEIYYTNVACRLLDLSTCQCTDYANRCRLVPDCLQLSVDLIHELSWMPETCAYRRLAEGKSLAWWHPLLSGDAESIHRVGISIGGKAVSEKDVDMEDIEDMVVDWFD